MLPAHFAVCRAAKEAEKAAEAAAKAARLEVRPNYSNHYKWVEVNLGKLRLMAWLQRDCDGDGTAQACCSFQVSLNIQSANEHTNTAV